LANVITATDLQNGEGKQRASLIFNCIQIADSLLEELFIQSKVRSSGGDEPSVQSLADILKNSKNK